METLTIKPNKTFSINLKELWLYRELLYFLSWRDIKVRYKQTLIGILWAVIQPLLAMLIFSFFFGKSFGSKIDNIPYAVFSYSGLLFWNYFSSSLSSISTSFFTNKTIITKVFFPRIIIPISAAIVPSVDFFFAFLFFIPLLLFFHVIPSVFSISVVFFCLVLSFLTSLSLGLVLSIINVKYRDVGYAVPFFIQLLLFVTPVIYPINILPQKYQLLLYLNPMTAVIQIARSSLFNNTDVDLIGVGVSFCTTLAFFIISIVVFKKYETYIADIV